MMEGYQNKIFSLKYQLVIRSSHTYSVLSKFDYGKRDSENEASLPKSPSVEVTTW